MIRRLSKSPIPEPASTAPIAVMASNPWLNPCPIWLRIGRSCQARRRAQRGPRGSSPPCRKGAIAIISKVGAAHVGGALNREDCMKKIVGVLLAAGALFPFAAIAAAAPGPGWAFMTPDPDAPAPPPAGGGGGGGGG